jgi:signal transduction histidine kinase
MQDTSDWRRYCSIQSIAGYVTWLAVTLGVLQTPINLASVGGIPLRTLGLVLLALFLLGFVIAAVLSPAQARRAYIGIALMTVTACSMFLLGLLGATPALLVMLTAVAVAILQLRAAVAVIVVANGVLLATALSRSSIGAALLEFAIFAGFQAFAAFASLAMRRATEAAETLRETNAHLLATRSLLAETARDGERLRLSRELHDVSGHKLTALKLNLALLAQDPAYAGRAEFKLARTLTDELLADLRGVVTQLRQHDGIDLSEALSRMASIVPAPRVHVDVAPEARIAGAERAESVLRIAQESLTNAMRHAGANNVHVRLRGIENGVELMVSDDGRAPADLRAGNGISGMRERIEDLGGTLDLTVSASGGLCVTARIPQAQPT